MNDYDYIITVDENGSPSLQHAWGMQKGATKDGHKWYARENIRGKWRYWYSPEEYRRWAQGGVQKAKQAVNNAPDIRENLTAPIKARVNNGTYDVSADDFASKLAAAYGA